MYEITVSCFKRVFAHMICNNVLQTKWCWDVHCPWINSEPNYLCVEIRKTGTFVGFSYSNYLSILYETHSKDFILSFQVYNFSQSITFFNFYSIHSILDALYIFCTFEFYQAQVQQSRV